MEQLGVIQDPMAYQGSARRYRADSCAAVTRPVTAVGKHSNWSHSEDPSSTQKSWNFTNRSNCRMIHPWKYMGNIPPKKKRTNHVANCMIWIMHELNFFYLHRLHRNQPSPTAKSGPPSKSNIPVPGHTWGHSDCTSFSLGFFISVVTVWCSRSMVFVCRMDWPDRIFGRFSPPTGNPVIPDFFP